jgi:putative ABC transport system permease protein
VKDWPIENVDFYQIVSKDYFKTMGTRLMEGRFFDERDGKGTPDVVIVNQTMARTFWKNESPIGKRIQPGYGPPWCTIIGVVEDVKNAGLDKPAGTELYLPYAQPEAAGLTNGYAVLRGRGDPRPLVAELRSKLDAIDPTIPLAQVKTMDAVLSEAQSQPRFLTLLLTLFSGAALVIATVGIYGVISYSVARRSKEFGLRMALGAQPGNVLSLVMKQGVVLTAVGVMVGVGAALALTRLMATLLFGVQPTDPITFLGVSALLAAVALAASYVPALRATKVDPLKALRYE